MDHIENYAALKKKAIILRKEGLSYGEIKKILGVSKSSLSLWLKSIYLKSEYKKRLYTKQIKSLSLGSRSQKERRAIEVKKIIEQAEDQIKFPLSEEALRMFGVALYWGEGSKRKMLEITNSDPYLILFFIHWLNKIFGIRSENLKARLNIHQEQSETKIKKFWSELTGIPFKNFGKTYIKPISGGYKNNKLYFGTLRLEVPKSVNIRYTILGWLTGLMKNFSEVDVEALKIKWRPLEKSAKSVNL